MNIDTAAFPLVKLQYNTEQPSPMDAVLLEMSALLARNRPFVFVAEGGLGDAHSDAGDHKKLTLWMKANKPQIRQNIKAHIHITADAAQQEAARAFMATFLKFWGYPMLVAASSEEAQRKAAELLAA